MKNVLKVSVLALGLGFFAVACHNSGSSSSSSDSTSVTTDTTTTAPPAAAPMDTSNMSMDTSKMDTTKH